MITLKYWNSLSDSCRKTILDIITNHGNYPDKLVKEYHHSFEFDAYGMILREYLNSVYLTKTHKIKIVTEMIPKFAPPKKKVKKKTKEKSIMHKYYFRAYREDDEDGENLWARALSEQEARDEILHDNWGITELDLIRVE